MTVRIATAADVDAVTALRRAWAEEESGPVEDGGAFERGFADWYAAEVGRRTTWLATTGEEPLGMLNLVEFRRMPRPGRPRSGWGYISNLFVLAEHRNGGLGRALLDAAIDAAKQREYARLVLSPSPRAVPLYERVGFARADELMLLPLS